MEELKTLPPNIPKIALVYGEYGLGKSETIKHWILKNDCIYVRATYKMSERWLLSEIAEELNEEATCRKFRQVRQEGNREVTREIPYYNLDMIISVGYRIRSIIATRFRQ